MARLTAVVAALLAAGLLAAAGFAVADRPHVLVVGDSITAQYGPPLAHRLSQQAYRVTVRGYPGIGLLDRGPRFNIDPLLRADLTSTKPDIVVAEFSGNYGLANPPEPGVPLASPAYFDAWTQAVKAFETTVHGQGARLVWVIPPRPRHNPTTAETLAKLYASRAAPGVDVLDTGPPVAARDTNGQLHAADGDHLSAEGATFVSGLIAHRVTQSSTWSVRLRAVHGAVPVLEVAGGLVLLLGAVGLAVSQR